MNRVFPKNGFLIFIILILPFSIYSQEICDNGIDDDSDGLIDLFDDDCDCGAGLNARASSAIRNPGFDNTSCCPPSTWAGWASNNLNCLDDWSRTTTTWWWGLQYQNSCDTCGLYRNWNSTIPGECYSPTSDGFLTFSYYSGIWSNWSNSSYAENCLATPLVPGNNYTLDVDLARVMWWSDWGGTQWWWNDTLALTLYGATSCNTIGSGVNLCSNTNWVPLDSLYEEIKFDGYWYTKTFTFVPPANIEAIAIGPSCNSTLGTASYHRFFMDDLVLEYSKKYNLQIAESGYFCTNDYLLNASIDTTGGTWQWYKDSIAIVGETNSLLDISKLDGGDYTIKYSLNGRCQSLTYSIEDPIYPFVFMNNNSNTCEWDTINFSGSSFIAGQGNYIANYYWDFGDGNGANSKDTNYQYQTSGAHTVSFIAESNLGCRDTVTQIINIYPNPDIAFNFSGDCIYETYEFVNMTTIVDGTIDSIHWDFDNNTYGTDSLISNNFAFTGNYLVELYAKSDKGCTDSILKPVFINPAPISSFTGLDTCAQSTFNFINNSAIVLGKIDNYKWNFGDVSVSNLTNPSHLYTNDGSYNIELIATSDSGCVDTSNLSLIAYPNPIANFNIDVTCFRAEFTNLSTGNITGYNWNFGSGNSTSNKLNPIYQYPSNGNYLTSLDVVTNFGCTDKVSKTVTVDTDFEAVIGQDTTATCEGGCITFFDKSISVAGDVFYLWQFSDGQYSTEENPIICFDNESKEIEHIDVFYKITTSIGCIDSARINRAVKVIPNPTAFFKYAPDMIPKSDPEVKFLNQSKLASNYLWEFGDSRTSNEIDPIHIYPEIAKGYNISLTASDASGLCSDKYESILIVEDEIIFYIPNAFTMNNNDLNDNFQPVFYSGVFPYEFQMEIFNRYGELVFVSKNPTIGWDGTYNNKQVKADTYIWKINFKETMSEKQHSHAGHVSVFR